MTGSETATTAAVSAAADYVDLLGSDAMAGSEAATTAAVAAAAAGTLGVATDTLDEPGAHDNYLNVESVETVQETRLGSNIAAGGVTTATNDDGGSGNGIREPLGGASWFHRTIDQSGSISLLRQSRAAGAAGNFIVRPGKKSSHYYLMVLDDKGRPWQGEVKLDPQTNMLKFSGF